VGERQCERPVLMHDSMIRQWIWNKKHNAELAAKKKKK
jgi:hypothetical protein